MFGIIVIGVIGSAPTAQVRAIDEKNGNVNNFEYLCSLESLLEVVSDQC